ncbi:MAG: hypothetical protein ACE5JN_09850 [Candidatus Methylomirabilia bacterium]
MRRIGLALVLAFTFGLTVLSGAAWAWGPHAFRSGVQMGVHAGGVKVFIGHGRHQKFRTHRRHHRFERHDHKFEHHGRLRHHTFGHRFHHHRFHPLHFRRHAIAVRPVPRPVWVAGFWHWNGFRWLWVPGHWIWQQW